MIRGRIMVVDDQKSIRDVVSQMLSYEGFAVIGAANGVEAIRFYQARPFDLVLLDVKMEGMDGMETLRQLRERDPEARIVMISGHGTIATAVEAVKHGAFDFLEKPLDADRLLLTVERALEHRRLVGENARLREGLERATDTRFAMVGDSAALEQIRALVARVAPTNARVLISGENGSGKELVARAIHQGSARRAGPFIEVNCAAIPSDLVESELFGHVRGAFTGATSDQQGKFVAADHGTLFLDEIGDLALNAQAKILRALQEGVIIPVGGSASIAVDVRVLAATNRDLSAEIAEGRFREDLYHRLNVMPIVVPPLRHRSGDIPELVDHFVQVLGNGPGMVPKPFTVAALDRLRQRHWPGNVRELRNAVERLLILASGEEVTAADVEKVLAPDIGPTLDVREKALTANAETLAEFVDQAEEALILARVRYHDGNVSEAARSLGLRRTTLYKKLERLGVEVKTL